MKRATASWRGPGQQFRPAAGLHGPEHRRELDGGRTAALGGATAAAAPPAVGPGRDHGASTACAADPAAAAAAGGPLLAPEQQAPHPAVRERSSSNIVFYAALPPPGEEAFSVPICRRSSADGESRWNVLCRDVRGWSDVASSPAALRFWPT